MRCDDDHGLKDPLNVSLKELEEDETGRFGRRTRKGKVGGWGGVVVFKWMVTRIGFVQMEIDARDRVPSDSWPCAPELVKKKNVFFHLRKPIKSRQPARPLCLSIEATL